MARLTAAGRRRLKPSQFGLPKQRGFPEEDRGHAIAAKGRAKTALRNGRITQAQYDQIVAKANRVIGRTGRTLSEKLA